MALIQPTLPVEGVFTSAELDFMENSPPGLFPDNQDSNFGLLRKLITDRTEELIDQQTTLYNERFVDTATEFLDEWERAVDLPINSASLSVIQRRQNVLGRLARGAFTRTRRAQLVEKFITATFGDPIQLTPAGVPLTTAGVPLYTEATDVTPLYRIVEDIPNFHYQVRIKDTVLLDLVGLTRELNRITPAHYSFDIVQVAIP